MAFVGFVYGLVERRLVGVELEDGSSGCIGGVGVDFVLPFAFAVFVIYDLLDILIGDAVEVEEVSPDLLAVLYPHDSALLELLLFVLTELC